MNESRRRIRTLRLPAEAQIVLTGASSALLVLNAGCALRTGSGELEPLAVGTLLLRATGSKKVDTRVARAIELMRARLELRHTVKSLARAVGLSRAAFARRFRQVTGVSPLRLLAILRLEHAVELLNASDAGLAEIASRVGYASEFAFSRAFKRRHGVSPSVFRSRSNRAPITMLRAA